MAAGSAITGNTNAAGMVVTWSENTLIGSLRTRTGAASKVGTAIAPPNSTAAATGARTAAITSEYAAWRRRAVLLSFHARAFAGSMTLSRDTSAVTIVRAAASRHPGTDITISSGIDKIRTVPPTTTVEAQYNSARHGHLDVTKPSGGYSDEPSDVVRIPPLRFTPAPYQAPRVVVDVRACPPTSVSAYWNT